jgi:hypothetical protein
VIKIVGAYAYLTNTEDENFVALNVANPASISLASSVDIGYPSVAFDTHGNYAYVGEQVPGIGTTGNIVIVDISNPNLMDLVRTVPVGINPWFFDISGNYIFASDFYNNRFGTYDISNPTNPTSVGIITNSVTLFGIDDVFVNGTIAYTTR